MKIGPRTCDAMALLLQMNSRFYNANTLKILEKDLTSFMDGPLPSNKPVMNETILMGLLRTACCSKVNAANKKEKIIIRARGNIRINTG